MKMRKNVMTENYVKPNSPKSFLEYCLPFVKINGYFIAMKGSNTEEFENSSKALDILGGKIEKIEKLELPTTNMERNVVIIRKFRQTPTKYPRKAGKPSKEPLI